jgi:hypothetical protein
MVKLVLILNPQEQARLKLLKVQLERMNKMRSMGIMMDEDMREDIEAEIKLYSWAKNAN